MIPGFLVKEVFSLKDISPYLVNRTLSHREQLSQWVIASFIYGYLDIIIDIWNYLPKIVKQSYYYKMFLSLSIEHDNIECIKFILDIIYDELDNKDIKKNYGKYIYK